MTGPEGLFSPLLRHDAFLEVVRRLERGERRTAIAGLGGSATPVVLALVSSRVGRPVLLVVPDDATLDARRRDLTATATILGRDPARVVELPALDADPYDSIAPHPEVVRERVVALGRLARGEVDFVLVPVRALLAPVPSPEEIGARTRSVRPGIQLAPERFVLELLASGYRRVDVVSAPGEITRRGGILDVFPPGSPDPVRIELFGDTVESIRAFDSDNQRSVGPLDEAVVGPASENPATDEAISRLRAWLDGGARRAREGGGTGRPFREVLERLQAERMLPGFEALSALTAKRPTTILEHAAGLCLVIDDPERCEEELARAHRDVRASWDESGERVLPAPDELFASPIEVRDRLRAADLILHGLEPEPGDGPERRIRIASRRARAHAGRIGELVEDLREARENGVRVLLAMRAEGSADRIGEIFREYDIPVARADRPGDLPADVLAPGGLFVVVGALRAGFEIPDAGLRVLTEREAFGDEKRPRGRKPSARAAFVSDFRDLREGDLVVHVDHGIARYRGLGRPKGGSLNRDFMVLEFAAGDRLFVPVDRLDLVQKYTGSAGRRPVVDKLGGPGWERVKSRVRKSVESMARELLELYARRSAASGHAFSPDTPWQRELEAAFPFELTPDQERVLAEVKSDMESNRPMDRLVVGDVGFGKTEIAVRAVFKAVMDGKQAAVLAPTTVLAVQHEETFRSRYAPFPVRVEMVSRFRSPAEVREIVRRVETGEVDVLVGTHRLLSRDVSFRRLGLLVVDEEQRFGVRHKERLKRLSLGVDVLAMTATPIPRTLQMSLAGVRDLSVIETPPPGRTAIQTYLVPFRKNVVAQAVRQEIRRDGQVFFVHDRIETLPALARAVQEMVPDARVVMAHGRMGERNLERVMLRFVHQEADVLVTTTIIENGLDIPSANTIVVNRADRFGLAQLYQLRGRVGRSDRPAYAYFLIPGSQTLPEPARQRLRALQEFSDLGAGFRLAAADLEIRGAGEFLGQRQHGHIASLGFDLYCQMLERAVSELQGETVVEREPATLHLGVDIKLPESYLPDVGDRLALYKRLAGADEERDVDRMQAETEDRFGHLPPSGRNLFDLARLRLFAARVGVRAADLVEGRLQLRFDESAAFDPARLVEHVARERGKLTPSGTLVLPAPERGTERIPAVRSVLERLVAEASP